MKIICAWCGRVKGEKPPYSDKSITHTICGECQKKVLEELEDNEKNDRKKDSGSM